MAEPTLAGGLPWLRLADEHRVARSSLHETLTRLVGEEQHLRREPDGTPRFVDPLLSHWLVRR